MSRIFYDHLIILTEVESEVKGVAQTQEDREELWKLIDEIIHHKVLGTILDSLPREYHEEFLEKFHNSPHDERHISYLNEKIGGNIEDVIREEIKLLEKEILEEMK
ncbi:hypothetical protein A2865_03445 [Candidatus Woesebacteria bacterium RIFCSPHIGHO2_01_FULL_39_17]|uniref:Uncharacterized protein n=3 Tax=Candidatus Woeseibacteriota TaxID=1752722 RepID=A0A0G0NNH3_9BACT|nr:MAG: hypothetical protein US72_C0007G0006 [Microgenomates group bacterium GW2011_GWC1_38_12]KKQ93793.1 MAG: hypothetical protein UT19_C0007G0037 [Candidatus Woesebacteria bacterium GW2011_GWB1_39_10b]KKR14356.1 MAG: hypothetical protein UT40_C0002G0035 [Candidatus Woesebacteria bacterium GW2011_GWA1_39_21b]OGM23587.1 MAG: hypothetical protein A2865_03445 [Candidatus Woesebacteria bacterium RIFCSPHIGHO2_01_FULL_39_17]OGM64323.1 MAG: hypothetical protein A3A52_05300 [Candidatus Woesebacteria b